MNFEYYLFILAAILWATLHILAIMCVFDAVMTARTSQGAIAWTISLFTFPYITLPLYLIFGRDKFHGYVDARRSGDLEIQHIRDNLANKLHNSVNGKLEKSETEHYVLEKLVKMPFTGQNKIDLLINGQNVFQSIFDAIEGAKDYILVQFYVVKDDHLGRKLKTYLKKKAENGVRVYFLYDEIGSHKLPKTYLADLKTSGVEIGPFKTTKGGRNRFQINFRNHRKIVIVDGRTAFVGGLNVGDEYLGLDSRFEIWRDTAVEVNGPAVQCIQLTFLEDWNWAMRILPELEWEPKAAANGNNKVLILPTGPADKFETCGLFYVHMINSAQKKVWIASPYFVPDRKVIGALQMAGLRGVDVRIILPQNPDQIMVYLAAFSYFELIESAGIKFYRYQTGFLHHKIVLVDDDVAAVGTANLDNRSFRLNFEITVLVANKLFSETIKNMMEKDLTNCRKTTSDELRSRPWWFQFAVRIARLFSPML